MLLLLATLLASAHAVPSHYIHRLLSQQPAVYAEHVANVRRLQGLSDPSGTCEKYRGLNATQPMWFAGSHCSIASMDMSVMIDGVLTAFKKGELVPLTCDNMFCPPPARIDCYKDPRGICGHFPGTECWIEQFERTGPWGRSLMQTGWGETLPGATVSTGIQSQCAELYAYIQSAGVDKSAIQTYSDMCGATGLSSDGSDIFNSDLPRLDSFYSTIQGQCVKPRQRGESCLCNRSKNDDLVYSDNGDTFERPLFCAAELQCLDHLCVKSDSDVAVILSEAGAGGMDEGMFCGEVRGLTFKCKESLKCTSAQDFLTPNTCVRKRPQRTTYFGPWWNSTNCPTMNNSTSAELVLDGLKVAMLTYPGELQVASSCTSYWMNGVVKRTHGALYNYISALVENLDTEVLNKDLNATGSFILPSFEDLWTTLGNVTVEPDTGKCNDTSSKVAAAKAELLSFGFQPCYWWSLIHFLTFNQKPVMTTAASEASSGIATWLRRYFTCEDCRGLFNGLVSTIGMADARNSSRDHHAQWWHRAHNLAGEHFASTRGGDPWLAQLWDPEYKKYQNPSFMTLEDAEDMWISRQRSGLLV